MKQTKLTQELIDKVIAKMETVNQKKMRRLMDYMITNPDATLVNTSNDLSMPLSTTHDLKIKLAKILKEIE